MKSYENQVSYRHRKTPKNSSAFSLDLPGCVATGSTQAEVEDRMREAIRTHLDGMREDGLAIPKPSSVADYIMVFQSLLAQNPIAIFDSRLSDR